jgi:uncharacterized protein
MSETLLKKTIKQAMTCGLAEISFGWQGGEPTLMGLPFFKSVVTFQQQFGDNQVVGNGLQTNGILIDREWARFLGKYRFLVGLSLDGPKHIHDKYRRLKGGKGTWSGVVGRAKMLLDSGVAVNALTVVNDYSVQFPEDIYHFHKSTGLNHMQFIPCVDRHPQRPSQLASFSINPQKYGSFLIRLFDLWRSDFKDQEPTTFIRLFDSLFFTYVGMELPDCHMSEGCGNYVVVEHNGDVFSCDFHVESAWYLGNIQNNTLVNMLQSPKQEEFGNLKKVLPYSCQTCPWLSKCYGGCPRERGFNGDLRNVLCQSLKQFFTHADPHYKSMAREWEKRNTNG